MKHRETELLPVPYFHIVFTLPHELNPLALECPKAVYNALFYASWQTIKAFARDPKFLGAKTGMTAILHTWGQNLSLHPHLHCIVPGGGITVAGNWKTAKHKGRYLFPKKAMSKVFRAKMMAKLRGSGLDITQPIAAKLFRKSWVVDARQPFASPKTVVEYLGRYTHKIAISNHRITNIAHGTVSFKYKDYRHGGTQKVMRLQATEFLRRFCHHVLPHGFVRIRHYGILASRNKPKELNLAKAALNEKAWEKQQFTWEEIARTRLNYDPSKCRQCKKGDMKTIQAFEPQRGPPVDSLSFNKILTAL